MCALLTLIAAVIDGVVDSLPAWSIDLGAVGGVGTVEAPTGGVYANRGALETTLSYLNSMNTFLPVDQGFLIISTVMSFYSALLAYRFARYVIGIVRGAGT